MPKKPTRQEVQKPAKRGKITLDRIAEKDLEIPADTLKKVKGGRIMVRSLCKGRNPRLERIPKLTCPLK